MNKYLITGASGFVAKHFIQYLSTLPEEFDVFGLDIFPPGLDCSSYSNVQFQFQEINLLDQEALKDCLGDFFPDYILHLASFSSVGASWKAPAESFVNNTNIFLNILESVRESGCDCRILSVGSSEEYGNVSEEDIPLHEDHSLAPVSPYAVARVSQEMLSQVYANGYGMDIVMTRSFNHIGPGQNVKFVVPGFIKRIVDAKRSGKKDVELLTGNLDIIRDFTDVRDVVKAYYLLFTGSGVVGNTFNICSGRGSALKDVVKKVADITGMKVTTKVNSDFIRPQDNMIIVGDNSKIKDALGWVPEIEFESTLEDVVTFFSEDNS